MRIVVLGGVRLENDTIDAGTIVLTAGIVPSAVASAIPVVRDQRGRIAVDATMRSRSHPQVWALGDCAAIPGPDGRPYPALAQHAVREARHLARNIGAAIDGRVLRRSCSAPSAPWLRSGIRAPSREYSVYGSRAS
jgi:NADH dehydrogenase